MNNTDFMKKIHGVLSTAGKDKESKRNALQRLAAMTNFEMTSAADDRKRIKDLSGKTIAAATKTPLAFGMEQRMNHLRTSYERYARVH